MLVAEEDFRVRSVILNFTSLPQFYWIPTIQWLIGWSRPGIYLTFLKFRWIGSNPGEFDQINFRDFENQISVN